MRLFITDIDDTLTVGESIPEKTKNSFGRLRAAGWDVMIATGRTWGLARKHARAVGVTQPSILCNGCLIADTKGSPLYSIFLDGDLAARILCFVWDLPAEIQLTGDGCLYCRPEDRETLEFYAPGGPVCFLNGPVLPVDKKTGKNIKVFRVGLWTRPELLEDLVSSLRGQFGDEAEVCEDGPQSLGIQSPGVSKGSSLDIFLEGLNKKFNLRPELIVAAGDHMNDLELLKRADVAAAPSNACDAVLNTAFFVYPPAGQNGICRLIDHLLGPS